MGVATGVGETTVGGGGMGATGNGAGGGGAGAGCFCLGNAYVWSSITSARSWNEYRLSSSDRLGRSSMPGISSAVRSVDLSPLQNNQYYKKAQ